jgi:hypothetical protein
MMRTVRPRPIILVTLVVLGILFVEPTIALAQGDDIDSTNLTWRDGALGTGLLAAAELARRGYLLLKGKKITWMTEDVADIEAKAVEERKRIERDHAEELRQVERERDDALQHLAAARAKAEQFAEMEAVKADAAARLERSEAERTALAEQMADIAHQLDVAQQHLDEYARMQEMDKLIRAELAKKEKHDDSRDP